MRIVVIGGTGHIGSYLVPELVLAGHQVVVLSRGERTPYRASAAWQRVELITADRDAEDAADTFGERVRALDADVVIDLICFTEGSARQLGEALRGQVRHLLHCGTIWVHGPSTLVPTPEEATTEPFGDYGIAKAAIAQYLLGRDGLPATVIHPGHISGPGWAPVNPAGHLDLGVFQDIANGNEITLPNLGLETVQHVHAADVAGVFLAALANRSIAIGESFHAVAAGAMTLRGYAEGVARWFGQEPRLSYLPWEEWRATVSDRDAEITLDHISHSPHCSMEKAARLLGFKPAYSALGAPLDALGWLVANQKLTLDRRAG